MEKERKRPRIEGRGKKGHDYGRVAVDVAGDSPRDRARARARVARGTKGREKQSGVRRREGEHGGREAKRGGGGQAGEKRKGGAK